MPDVTTNSSWSVRWLVSWKSPCRPAAGKSCHKNTSTRRWRTSPHTWLPVWLLLPIVVTSSICSNSVHLTSLHPHFITNKPALSEPQTDYEGIQRSECWEMGIVLVKQHDFKFCKYILTNPGVKVYILFFSSCVKFMQKFACTAETLTKVAGCYFFIHNLSSALLSKKFVACRQNRNSAVQERLQLWCLWLDDNPRQGRQWESGLHEVSARQTT